MALPNNNQIPRLRFKQLKYQLLKDSHQLGLAHIPSALSQLRYLKDLIPLLYYKYPEYRWVAGKQFGYQAYHTVYKALGLTDLIPNNLMSLGNPLLLNGTNKEFAYVEETLGNSLGVAIGMAMVNPRPIWVNVSDSTFLMGRTLEALKIIKKFNLNILITVDCNECTRASEDKMLNLEICGIAEAYKLEVFSTTSAYPNNFNEEFDKALTSSKPRILVISTVKGDGFEEFEDDPIGWHYRKMTEMDYHRIAYSDTSGCHTNTDEYENIIKYIN